VAGASLSPPERDRIARESAVRTTYNRFLRRLDGRNKTPSLADAESVDAWQQEERSGIHEPASSPVDVPMEIVTSATIESELIAYVAVAGQLLAGDVTQAQVDSWASGLGVGIRARGPHGEEEMFLVEGNELDARAELRAKVARLQNHILPKVRAGEWTQPQ
jgi:hypothetical protein